MNALTILGFFLALFLEIHAERVGPAADPAR